MTVMSGKTPQHRSRLRVIALSALTPLLEKNVMKTVALDLPVVFSMSRLIVLAFAAGMLRQLWRAGVAGWPEATLAIAIVLALPILSALEHATPAQVLELARALIDRLGVGGVRQVASVYDLTREPSKYDDHRQDG
jgi:peptidoglycan/LPS O-acetylase OafA/YrhL